MSLFCLIARQKKAARFPEHVLGLERGAQSGKVCRVIHEEPIEPVHQPEPGAAVFEPVADFLFHYYPDLPAGRLPGGNGAYRRSIRHGRPPEGNSG